MIRALIADDEPPARAKLRRYLAAEPDVLLYAGGTNDLPSGPLVMLEGLEQRLRAASERTCVVVAVPIFRYEPAPRAEVEAASAGTRLLEDRSDPLRFVTIDSWSSVEEYDAFRVTYASEYAALDRLCEGLTVRETHIGQFTSARDASSP